MELLGAGSLPFASYGPWKNNPTTSFRQTFPLSVLSSSSTSAEVTYARDDLLHLISEENRGLLTQKNPKRRSEIIRTIEALASMQKEMTTTDEKLSATWRMLWTTEKEQLFIIEKAGVFGTETGDIFQVIDVAKRSLNNVITFPPHGSFIVNSIIEVVSAQRVNFKFTSAKLSGRTWTIALPPFGQGWFETIYIDEMMRVAKDVRGDYLVVEKASCSWKE